jgi:hypothetical protein
MNTRLNTFYVLSLAGFLSFLACKHAIIESPQQPCTLLLPRTISFSTLIQPVFNAHCTTGCHAGAGSSGSSLNLLPGNAYAALFKNKDIDTLSPGNSVLYLQMNSLGTPMPPAGRLDNCTLEFILQWIQQGAKDN